MRKVTLVFAAALLVASCTTKVEVQEIKCTSKSSDMVHQSCGVSNLEQDSLKIKCDILKLNGAGDTVVVNYLVGISNMTEAELALLGSNDILTKILTNAELACNHPLSFVPTGVFITKTDDGKILGNVKFLASNSYGVIDKASVGTEFDSKGNELSTF